MGGYPADGVVSAHGIDLMYLQWYNDIIITFSMMGRCTLSVAHVKMCRLMSAAVVWLTRG